MYFQASSSKFQSITQPPLLLAGWEGSLGTCSAVGSNSLETTYILHIWTSLILTLFDFLMIGFGPTNLPGPVMEDQYQKNPGPFDH